MQTAAPDAASVINDVPGARKMLGIPDDQYDANGDEMKYGRIQ
jgi:hypothetical protein